MSCSPSASRASRSGAGEGWLAQAAGRKTKSSAWLVSAASCRRRSEVAWTSGSQTTMAPTPSAASERSQAQAASRPGALATSRRERSTPPACNAGAYSRYGGAMQTSQASSSRESRASAGSSRLSSPTPRRNGRSSVTPPRGQPPPGNSRSRSAKPVGTPGSAALASVSPRQTSGRSRICASVVDDDMVKSGWQALFRSSRRCGSSRQRCLR